MPEQPKVWARRLGLITLAATVAFGLATAQPGERDRVGTLAGQLRCPVCTSESVWDSPSDTARAMVTLIEEKVAAGDSDEEILTFFVVRYGEWILLDPSTSGAGLLLWLIPALALVLGVSLVLGRLRLQSSGRKMR